MRIKRFLVALAIGGVSLVAAARCGDDVSGGQIADGGVMVLDGGIPPPPPPPSPPMPPPPPMPPYVTSPQSTEGR